MVGLLVDGGHDWHEAGRDEYLGAVEAGEGCGGAVPEKSRWSPEVVPRTITGTTVRIRVPTRVHAAGH
jgi:hypothetical protein